MARISGPCRPHRFRAQQRQFDKLTRETVSGTTFEAVARELRTTKHSGWSPRYAARWIERMEKDLFPWIGSLPLQGHHGATAAADPAAHRGAWRERDRPHAAPDGGPGVPIWHRYRPL
jgi:hypothetical protein